MIQVKILISNVGLTKKSLIIGNTADGNDAQKVTFPIKLENNNNKGNNISLHSTSEKIVWKGSSGCMTNMINNIFQIRYTRQNTYFK